MFRPHIQFRVAVWSASLTALCVAALSFVGAATIPRRAALASNCPAVDQPSQLHRYGASSMLPACRDSQQALAIAIAFASIAATVTFTVSTCRSGRFSDRRPHGAADVEPNGVAAM